METLNFPAPEIYLYRIHIHMPQIYTDLFERKPKGVVESGWVTYFQRKI